ncbi:hypothetical protein LX32DRAFT_637856 [Colletotrichum zoysiae]|uniref:Uncharacterized protein n=1 Tax=Colletotrichum zoysiae TaxID=1216348 RepID=A0AAD9M3Q9_9PEZI|nr:hypothetical protein LX32DRAFT_637856 [Colletotrichum zoysiae]
MSSRNHALFALLLASCQSNYLEHFRLTPSWEPGLASSQTYFHIMSTMPAMILRKQRIYQA